MKIEKVECLNIELKGDDASNFKKVVEKVVTESNKIGFVNKLSFSEKELNLFKDLNNNLK